MNLLGLGYEGAADALGKYLRQVRQPRLVWVLPTGKVRTTAPDCDRYAESMSANWLLGCFTPQTPIEVLEDNLLERERELRSVKHG